MKNNKKALILAAGEGSRLHPLTLDRPKCLIDAGGQPLIDYQLDILRQQQYGDIVFIKGYLADRLERPGARYYTNSAFAETNMVWTLFCARDEFDADLVVSYGDIAYGADALRALDESSADIAVVVDRLWHEYWQERYEDPLEDLETLRIDGAGRIVDIGQKPKSMDEIQGQYIGLMKFTQRGLKALEEVFDEAVSSGVSINGRAPEKAYMTDLLQAVINRGHSVVPVFIDGGWVEVDTIDDLNAPITQARLSAIRQEQTKTHG